ncbi:zinc-binding dehydrogenase [Amycolatopsis sp. RM579]|uniref:Zinc-binding dehydrogenase n=2 Tax=Amycolatopsis pithecellobii TaxID=664692 RepID=A0A6N7Z0T0_9PSEU|nr:zinc-binding dehydrogenase [Amycolatopsis pithecellobii]
MTSRRPRRVELAQWGIDNLAVTDVDRPEPGPGQVLVRTQAVSLNFRDLLVVGGVYDPKMPLPLIPLSDSAGTIVQKGPGAVKFGVGTRVMPIHVPGWVAGRGEPGAAARGGEIPGVLADFVVFDERDLVEVPAHLSPAEAATLPCAAVTAWNGLFGGAEPVQAGHRVLILGTGGVGLFALQFAKLAGAEVTITSQDDAKLAMAADLGADHVINYREDRQWGRTAKKIFDDIGADVVLELGGGATLPESLRAVRRGGTVALIGSVTGAVVENLSLPPIFMRAVTMRGVAVGPRDLFEDMNRAISQHQLRPVIDRVFHGLEAIGTALESLATVSHFGKLVLEVSE